DAGQATAVAIPVDAVVVPAGLAGGDLRAHRAFGLRVAVAGCLAAGHRPGNLLDPRLRADLRRPRRHLGPFPQCTFTSSESAAPSWAASPPSPRPPVIASRARTRTSIHR